MLLWALRNKALPAPHTDARPRPRTHIDLVKLPKVHGLEAVDGGAQVLAVGAGFDDL